MLIMYACTAMDYQTKNVLITPSATSKFVIIRAHSYAPSLRGFRFGNPLSYKTAKLTKSCQRVFSVNQNIVAFSFTFEKKNISKEIIVLF